MRFDFSNKTALVTGASRGIGKEITKELARYGAKVFGLVKPGEDLEALKTEVPSVTIIIADLADWDETRRLVDAIEDIDFLVNNAGIGELKSLEEITEDHFDRIFSVNVKPVINLSQIVSGKLKKHGRNGSIVNISSSLTFINFPNLAVYSASKAAVDRLTIALAADLGPYGIRVNSVNPTMVATDMSKEFRSQPEQLEEFLKRVPLNDICSVRDISNAVLFLLSDEARMITGTNLKVDGGNCIS